MPPAPQLSPPMHVPHMTMLPQPSPITPQFAPIIAQVRASQPDVPPHCEGTPPPPPVSGRLPPQPSPIGPQLACSEAQVTRPHPGPVSVSIEPSLSTPTLPLSPPLLLLPSLSWPFDPSCRPPPPPPGASDLHEASAPSAMTTS